MKVEGILRETYWHSIVDNRRRVTFGDFSELYLHLKNKNAVLKILNKRP